MSDLLRLRSLLMPFTALHRLLGRDPSPITDELIDAAVAEQLAETNDLDWKRELPPTKGLSLTDFPKDVASMANSGGGVIVYGVEEQGKRATGRRDVGELTENHERTLRAAAYGAISPPVSIGIDAVGVAGNRAVVVLVPPSVDGPHLIFRDQFFGAPLRNDADTEWMNERQIEAAYRARLDERRRSAAALAQLYDETASSWLETQRALLIAVGRPRIPLAVTKRIERAGARSVFTDARKLASQFGDDTGIHPLDNVANNPRPGLRRWVAINTATTEKTEWRAAWASLHLDGAVSMAATVGGHRRYDGVVLRDSQVDSSAIETAVVDFMALIRVWRHELGTDEYEVRVGIEWQSPKPLLMQTVDGSGHPYDGTSLPLKRYVPIEATVDAAADQGAFRRRIYEIAEDSVNQGGISTVRTIDFPEPDDGPA